MAINNIDEKVTGSDTPPVDGASYDGTTRGIANDSIVVPFAASATPPTGGVVAQSELDPSDPDLSQGGGNL